MSQEVHVSFGVSMPNQNFGLKIWFHVASQTLILSENLKISYSSHAAYFVP